MNDSDIKDISKEEEVLKEKLEDLNYQINGMHPDLPCLKQCSRVSHLLQKIYEIRVGLNRLEQGLLQGHLKCCISPATVIPLEATLAVSSLSAKHHGAIIVFEQNDDLGKYVDGGVIMDAALNASLIENIFYPGSPLHDGALLIRNYKIVKARVLLPLAMHAPELEAIGLGTRHRAALGISQASDALAIVVSEEKGWISMALKGQFYPNLGTYALLESLEKNTQANSVKKES